MKKQFSRKHLFHSILTILCLASLFVTGCSKSQKGADQTSTSSSSLSSSSSPQVTGEGAAPSDLPDLEEAIQRKTGESCEFTQDGQASYSVTILSIEKTDRPATTDTQQADLVLLVTYTYQSLGQDPVLVDDMSFRCIADEDTVCSPYYLTEQKMPELSEDGQTVTAELAYSAPADTSQISLYLENPADTKGEKFLISVEL